MAAMSVILLSFLLGQALVFPTVHSFGFTTENVKVIDGEELNELLKKDSVTVVYYYKRALARMVQFITEYDKSAEYLSVYGVTMAVVDCQKHPAVETCLSPKSEFNVYTYRNGQLLLSLEVTTMFDVNSIMSNVLQLVLLNEVPIVQSSGEMQELTSRHKQKQNVVIGYFKGIGSAEHRVFMEIAFAYMDKYAFAVTTQKDTVLSIAPEEFAEADASSMIAILYCAEAQGDAPCESSLYLGSHDLPSLAKFFRILGHPVYDLPKDEAELPCTKEKVDCMYLFYSKATWDKVKEVADIIHQSYRGTVVTVLVDLSQVDIKAYSLPNAEGPFVQMKLQSSEEMVVREGEWSTVAVVDFVLSKVLGGADKEQEHKPGFLLTGSSKHPDLPDVATVEEVETQDDQVAESVYRTSITTPMAGVDLIPALTDKTFLSIKDKDLVMVLYYLPFDARSGAFLRAYGEAVEKFPDPAHSPLARINCFDWTDVCGKENITIYPTIRIFRKGREPMEYKGALDTDAVVSTMTLLMQPNPLVLKSEKEFEDFSKGELPQNIAMYTGVSIFAVIPSSSQDALKSFRKVADDLHHLAMFGQADEQLISKAMDHLGGKLPVVAAFKHRDPLQPMDLLSGSDITVSKLTEFVEKSLIPSFVELTPMVFPALYKEGRPLLVLFCKRAHEDNDEFSVVSNIAASGQFKDIFFTWMDAEKQESVGARILAEYTKSAKIPALSVVYNKKGEVYNFPSPDISVSAVVEWLKAVLAEKTEPSVILPKGEWKPLARPYDFLTLIDYEKSHPDFSLVQYTFDEGGVDLQTKNLEQDEETRSELSDLHQSRVYRKERGTQGVHSHSHSEL